MSLIELHLNPYDGFKVRLRSALLVSWLIENQTSINYEAYKIKCNSLQLRVYNEAAFENFQKSEIKLY